MDKRPQLIFHQGTLLLKEYEKEMTLPCFRWDDRSRQWRAKAIYYSEVLNWLSGQSIEPVDTASQISDIKLNLRMQPTLRPYQKEAVAAWEAEKMRGSVSLPTGSGKSWVALKAMSLANTTTLVVLPTIDLMNQWYDLLTDAFAIEVGILGGGYHEIRDVTVTTYDSAYIHIDKYGDRFGLLIFDEVHHLPAPTYTHIPEMSIAPYRLGLTATYERLDGLHGKLEHLLGPVVYEKSIRDLEGKHLSEYETVKIPVELLPAEKKRYAESRAVYEQFIHDRGLRFYGADLQDFLQKSAYDPQARRALLARQEVQSTIIGARRKLDILETLLKRHHQDQVLIFTASNDLVYEISRLFLIPAITHHTPTVERKAILKNFRESRYSVLITSKVLNEGVDVPNANVAVILSGSASPVEHVQRLGRILRKHADKQATLYELVTRGTQESQVSYRRRKSDAYE